MLNHKRIYLGCEQLGGTDWGDYDINETIDLANNAVNLGFDGFDIADAYSLGLAEERLSKVLDKCNNPINFITKGGVRWEKVDKYRAKTWKDNSVEYLNIAFYNSLKRLGVSNIPIYLIHWYDEKSDLKKSLEFLQTLKQKGDVCKIGISNPPDFIFNDTSILSLIDHIQLSSNILNPFAFPPNFAENKSAYDISISVYGILSHGLLTNKYDNNTVYSSNDRRHRLPQFNSKKYSSKRDKLFLQASKMNCSLEHLSISWCINQPLIDILIVGCKNIKQAKNNIYYFLNPIS